MIEAITSWEKARDFALSLPSTESSKTYGMPCVSASQTGHAFVVVGKEQETSFAVLIDLDTVELLKETEPETYWQTPHYEGHPAILVRFDGADPERVRDVIARAYEQATAKKPKRKR